MTGRTELALAAAALVAIIAGGHYQAVSSNPGSIGLRWAWVLASAGIGIPTMFGLGLAGRWLGGPYLVGAHFAWMAILTSLVASMTVWNGAGVDLPLIVVPAVGLAWLANWFGTRLFRGD